MQTQANRVCLGDLTGVDFPGEKHPATCPCDIARQKERLDQERAERRREEERRREKEREEEKREEQRRAVESKIEGKKRQFYRWTRKYTQEHSRLYKGMSWE